MKKKEIVDKGRFESIWEDNSLITDGALIKITMDDGAENLVRVMRTMNKERGLGVLIYSRKLGVFMYDSFKLPITKQELTDHIFKYMVSISKVEFLQ